MSKDRPLKIVLGTNPVVEPIKSGELRPPNATLDFEEFEVTNHAFKPMVNEQAFDISELAIVTLILAKAHGRPLHMLPAVMLARLQHPFASVRPDLEMAGPADIAGKRIGVRALAQTTVTWLRGILHADYGADLGSAHWVSFEDGHIPEVPDPTERAPEGRKLAEMLKAGELDIALGLKSSDPDLKPLIPDPGAAAQNWYSKHGCLSINHVVAVTEVLVANRLDTVAEVHALLREAKARRPHEGPGPDPHPIGYEAMRPSIELLLRYMTELDLLPRPMRFEDLIDPRIREAIGE